MSRSSAEGFIRQALAPLPKFSDAYAVIGGWLVDHEPLRLVDPRGRKSDHRQHIAISAARNSLTERNFREVPSGDGASPPVGQDKLIRVLISRFDQAPRAMSALRDFADIDQTWP
jgi:hypothetical protein